MEKRFRGREISKRQLEEELVRAKYLAAMSKYGVNYNGKLLDMLCDSSTFRDSILNFMNMYMENELSCDYVDGDRVKVYLKYCREELVKDSRRFRTISASDFVNGWSIKKEPKQKSLRSINIECAIKNFYPKINELGEEYEQILEAFDLNPFVFIKFYKDFSELINSDEVDIKEIIYKTRRLINACIEYNSFMPLANIKCEFED